MYLFDSNIFLIGERSGIRTLLIISAFIFLIYEMKIKYKIMSLSALTLFVVLLFNINPNYKLRYIDQFTKVLTKDGIKYYFYNTVYGAHYNVARIFKDNKFWSRYKTLG